MHSSLIIAGSLASEVTIEDTDPSVARFRVIIHSRRRDPGSGLWANGRPTVLPVVCRRRLAENVAVELRQGDPVVLAGRLRVCEAGRRPFLEIEAWAIGPDLARTRAQISRAGAAA